MSKSQYWSLTLTGAACAFLILSNVILARANNQLSIKLIETQRQSSNASQVQAALDGLSKRLAQSSQREPALTALMVRHRLTVPPANGQPGLPR